MKRIAMLTMLAAVLGGAVVLTGAGPGSTDTWILIDDIDQWQAEWYCGNPAVRDFVQGPRLEGAAAGVIAFDSKGNGYVACGAFIQVVTTEGAVRILTGSPGVSGNTDGPPWKTTFGGVQDIALASDDLIYVVDSVNLTLRQIERVDGVWITTTVAGSPGKEGHADGRGGEVRYKAPFDSVAVEGGVVYTLDGDWLRKYQDGKVTTLNAGTGYENGPLAGAKFSRIMGAMSGLAADGKGNLYIGDRWNMAIRKVDLNKGEVSTIAGCLPGADRGRPKDGTLFEARFHPGGGPMSTFFHKPSGRVVVRSADEGGRIRMIDEKMVMTFGPGPGSEKDRPLTGPWKNCVGGNPAGIDNEGNIYVRGSGGIRVIRKVGGESK